jgi:hypothetical protein
MDDIRLPSALLLLWDLKRAIETQKSLQTGIRHFVERKINDDFTKHFQILVPLSESEIKQRIPFLKLNVYQKNLIFLVAKGVSGFGIYPQLNLLEKEYLEICDDDIEKHIQILPLKLQAPLLGLIFPALMMILLIPVVNMLSL